MGNCGILLIKPSVHVDSEQNDLSRVLDDAAPYYYILTPVGKSSSTGTTIPPAAATYPPTWPQARTRPAHRFAASARCAPAHPHRSRRCRQNPPLARGRSWFAARL